MDLLSLPYDIRYQIYKHLFPAENQIYIQVLDQKLQGRTIKRKVPTNLLLTCRALHIEAGDYLYSSYLFNIIGDKRLVLSMYQPFVDTTKKYARDEVRVEALSNGSHSSTMCMSIYAGDAKKAIINRRERGEPKAIHDLEQEVAAMPANRRAGRRVRTTLRAQSLTLSQQVTYAALTLIGLLLAIWVNS